MSDDDAEGAAAIAAVARMEERAASLAARGVAVTSARQYLHRFFEVVDASDADFLAKTRHMSSLAQVLGVREADVKSHTNKNHSMSLKSLRKGMNALPGEIIERIEDVGEAAGKAIRRKPLQWVGIAAGIGLIVGMLAMTRSRD